MGSALALPPAAAAVSPGGGSSAAAPAAVVGVRRSAVAGHLDPELSAVQDRSVHRIHRVLGVPIVVKAHEGEAPALF